ncbi:hypothetical protein [Thalassococcus sp. S3]|uniref:hypothetical protein n=1 Tax=Thalassococcus sp. S3 TaxID=2017482 RepID=UPI0010247AA9|nr:hypothetical protein [Thalassococcus sp. S3]QBF32155.1 hypothetical protein CFI11_13130 [Thalassococcus sp. S3]
MAREFDLLGDPIPENFGKPGANGHTPNAETCRKVRVLLVAGLTKARIAEELGITLPTLNKHYFRSGRVKVEAAKEAARADQRARLMLKLDEAVSAGNVSAMRALKVILDEEDIKQAARDAAGEGKPEKKRAAPIPPGKKAQLTAAAAAALEEDDLLNPEWTH